MMREAEIMRRQKRIDQEPEDDDDDFRKYEDYDSEEVYGDENDEIRGVQVNDDSGNPNDIFMT